MNSIGIRGAGRRPALGFLGCAAVWVCVLLAPALYRASGHGKLPFDDHLAAELAASQADYVFIGNSMLGTRIDVPTLESELGPRCCFLLWTGGGESAWMHQALKNFALAVPHRPKEIFLFFRDAALTRPTYRTSDLYWWKIERMSHGDEPDLMRAMRTGRTWQENLEYELGLLYPIEKRRENAKYFLQWLAADFLDRFRDSYGAPVSDRYNALFSLDRMKSTGRADDADDAADDSGLFDFDGRLPDSLLPSMIAQGRDAGAHLVFVRVQRRPTPTGPPQDSAALHGYLDKLQAYLRASHAGYYDFTGDPEITLAQYQDGDHIRDEYRPASSRLFLKRMRDYFH